MLRKLCQLFRNAVLIVVVVVVNLGEMTVTNEMNVTTRLVKGIVRAPKTQCITFFSDWRIIYSDWSRLSKEEETAYLSELTPIRERFQKMKRKINRALKNSIGDKT